MGGIVEEGLESGRGSTYCSGQAEISLSFLRDPNDPRDSKSPQWPPYTTAAQQYVSLNLKPLEVRRGLRAQTCAFWNRFLPKLLSATGRRVGSGSRECTRRQGLEGGEREGVQNTGCNPSLLHLPQPRRLPAPAQAPPMGRLPRGPGPTYPCPSSASFFSSTPGFRGSNYNPFPFWPQSTLSLVCG